jgi:thiol-disulfide isomerase/thioredoxin
MTTGRVVLATVLAGVISIGLALFGQQWLGEGKPLDIQLPDLVRSTDDRLHSLPEFSLPDLQGHETASSTWAGKVVVINFWATWCPPCLREIPLLAEAQERYRNLQVVGIAIDNGEDVARFVGEHRLNYPVLLGGTNAVEMSRRLGNRLQGLPFTVIFDRQGNRIHSQIGELTPASLEKHLGPLLGATGAAQTAGN